MIIIIIMEYGNKNEEKTDNRNQAAVGCKNQEKLECTSTYISTSD